MFSNPLFNLICRDELQRRILASAHNVFRVMADIVLEECHEEPCGTAYDWVSALIGFDGIYSGLVALHCPEPLARRTAAGLLCMQSDPDIQDVHDAMGEVVNILGGDLKLLLDKRGGEVQLSMPSVFVSDAEFRDELMASPETVSCRMTAGGETLMIGVHIERGD